MNGIIRFYFHRSDRIKYINISEFFRFCGFSVRSTVMGTEDFEREDKARGADTVVIIRRLTNTLTGKLDEKKVITLEDNRIDDIRESSLEMIQKMIKEMLVQPEDKQALLWLSSVFTENKLAEKNYSLRFLADGQQSSLNSIYNHFINAYKCAMDNESLRRSKYGKYFLVNIKRKINEAAIALKRKKTFKSEELIEETDRILERYPGFHQAYMLQGLIADMDLNLRGYSITFYDKALKFGGQYDDCVLYQIAQYYEKNKKNQKLALQFYRKAYEVNPENYRALYKMALIEEWNRNYKASISDYEKLCAFLAGYVDDGCAEPPHIEYLFKTYWRMARIHRVQFERWYTAREYINKALNLNRVISDSSFFDNFYSNEAEMKRECMRACLRKEEAGINHEKVLIDAEISSFERQYQ